MIGTFHDCPYPRFSGGVPLRPDQYPHGLIQVPQEVLDIVEKQVAKFPPEIVTPESRKRMIDDLTLQYYFEGEEIAYSRTAQGIEVFAVGLEEIGKYIRKHPYQERPDVVFEPV
jgi:hypothetical protein